MIRFLGQLAATATACVARACPPIVRRATPRPPRCQPKDDPPSLIVRAVMDSIEDLAKARRIVGARVAYKKNAAGEHVVGLIFPSQPP